MITIFTDGSADNRHKRGGWAAIIAHPSTLVESFGYTNATTSNRMEMVAAIEGLRQIQVPSEISLVSDSAYLINTLNNKWYERWSREGKSRPNLDLWEQLIGLVHFHNVTLIKVKGHSGNYWNERADHLADMARVHKISGEHTIDNFVLDNLPACIKHSLSGRQCSLHCGHYGSHRYTRTTQRKFTYADSTT